MSEVATEATHPGATTERPEGRPAATETEEREVAAVEQEERPLSLDVIYTEVKDRLDVQLRQIDALDSKGGTILFVANVVLGIGAAAQAAVLSFAVDLTTLLVFSVPIFGYFATVFFGLRGWVVKPYFRDPEPRPLRDHYLFRDPAFTKRRLIAHFISSYEWNSITMKRKVRDLRIAMLFLFLETGSLAMVLVIRAWAM
ncbi:MAG: hypothetical protein ACOC58_03670 [Chloroflexota bacterium]